MCIMFYENMLQEKSVEYAESNPELEENIEVQSLCDHYEATQH